MTDVGLIDPEFMQPSVGLDEEVDPHFSQVQPPEVLTEYFEMPAVSRCVHLAELLEQFPYSISEAVRCSFIGADAMEAADKVAQAQAPGMYDTAITALTHAMMWLEVAIGEYNPECAPYEYRYGDPAGTIKRCAISALMTDKGRSRWHQKLLVRKAYYERYAALQFLIKPDNWADSTTMDGLKLMQEWLGNQVSEASERKQSVLQDINNEVI